MQTRNLGLQRAFQNGLGQLFEQTVLPDDILGLLVICQQLIDQLLVDCHGAFHFLPPMAVYTVLFTPSVLEDSSLRDEFGPSIHCLLFRGAPATSNWLI